MTALCCRARHRDRRGADPLSGAHHQPGQEDPLDGRRGRRLDAGLCCAWRNDRRGWILRLSPRVASPPSDARLSVSRRLPRGSALVDRIRVVHRPSGRGRWYCAASRTACRPTLLLRGTFAAAGHAVRADGRLGVQTTAASTWGLGPALWRLPFEAGADRRRARVSDRVALLLAFVAASLACARPFRDVRPLERFVLAAMVAPLAFVTLCRTRLAVYEESVAYAHLVAVVMAALLLSFCVRRRGWRSVRRVRARQDRAAVSPDVLFGGHHHRARLRRRCCRRRCARCAQHRARSRSRSPRSPVVALDAAIGIRASAVRSRDRTAAQRLVHPRRSGGEALRLPFRAQPFAVAAAELLSFARPAGAGGTRRSGTRRESIPGQAPVVRFREFTSRPFTVPQLVLLIGRGRDRRCRAASVLECVRAWIAAPVGVAALWSAAVAAVTMFYLWAPSMTSIRGRLRGHRFGGRASALSRCYCGRCARSRRRIARRRCARPRGRDAALDAARRRRDGGRAVRTARRRCSIGGASPSPLQRPIRNAIAAVDRTAAATPEHRRQVQRLRAGRRRATGEVHRRDHALPAATDATCVRVHRRCLRVRRRSVQSRRDGAREAGLERARASVRRRRRRRPRGSRSAPPRATVRTRAASSCSTSVGPPCGRLSRRASVPPARGGGTAVP